MGVAQGHRNVQLKFFMERRKHYHHHQKQLILAEGLMNYGLHMFNNKYHLKVVLLGGL